MTTRRTPDALILPHSAADGPRERALPNLDRTLRLCAIAEPILGVDYEAGGRAYFRNQRSSRSYFATRSSDADSIDRYRWETVGDYQYGYLDAPRIDPET